MSRLVAVEDGLDPVGDALREAGYHITKLVPGHNVKLATAVVTGLSNNVLGIQETDGNRFPIIEAAGKTAREIVDMVKSRGLL